MKIDQTLKAMKILPDKLHHSKEVVDKFE